MIISPNSENLPQIMLLSVWHRQVFIQRYLYAMLRGRKNRQYDVSMANIMP